MVIADRSEKQRYSKIYSQMIKDLRIIENNILFVKWFYISIIDDWWLKKENNEME